MEYILPEGKIIFLYKLKYGISKQSLPKFVKIPTAIMEMTRKRSIMMEKNVWKGKTKKLNFTAK